MHVCFFYLLSTYIFYIDQLSREENLRETISFLQGQVASFQTMLAKLGILQDEQDDKAPALEPIKPSGKKNKKYSIAKPDVIPPLPKPDDPIFNDEKRDDKKDDKKKKRQGTKICPDLIYTGFQNCKQTSVQDWMLYVITETIFKGELPAKALKEIGM